MSHLRRVLTLVMRNDLTGMYSLRRVNLLSRQNNLFYPTAKAAEDAAAAKDPAVLFPLCSRHEDGDGPTGEESLAKLERMQVPPPRLSFQPPPGRWRWWGGWGVMDCAALSESKTVFVERQSGGAFLYDADARCVVTMPTFPPDPEDWPCGRQLFPVSGAGAKGDDDAVYVMDRGSNRPEYHGVDEAGFKFRALVHGEQRRWQLEELPRPPYFDHDARRYDKEIASYAMMAGAAAGAEVICVSTQGRGTYCFDTASRAWSKAGNDWALPFAGEVVRDRELGIWLGFLQRRHLEDHHRLCASSDLFTDVDSKCRDLEPPSRGWDVPWFQVPQVVSLGSGKFCVTQFFDTNRPPCSECGCEDTDKSFAVFTGVEVIRRRGSDDHNDEQDGSNGSGSTNIMPPTELRLIMHKSKRYMLTQGNGIEFVL